MSSSSSSSSFSIPTATTIHNLYQSHCPQSVRNVVQLGTDEVKTCWYQMQHGSLATSVTATAAAAAVAASKGNDGRSPYQRRRRICRWILVVLFLFVGYRLLVVHFLAGLVPDIEIDPTTGRKRIRRRPERTKKVDEHGNVVPRTPLDGIVEGQLHLIDIVIPDDDSLFTVSRYNVKGIFCALEWNQQTNNPSGVPLFEDVIRASRLCGVTRHQADLFTVTQNAKAWDLHFRNVTLDQKEQKRQRQKHLPQPKAQAIERSIAPTALIFHESRCGSTLVSNVLASFAPDGSSRVYSEAAAPLKALEACLGVPQSSNNNTTATTTNKDENEENEDSSNDNNENNRIRRKQRCSKNPNMHQHLIRDVFYMMGRTQLRGPDHNYVFYKLQATAVHHLDLLERSFGPDNMPPWMYLYRDNIHVMQSHLAGSVVDPASEERNVLGQKTLSKCLEGFSSARKRPKEVPQSLQDVVGAQIRTIESLTKEEYCAANLASLSESAMAFYQHQKSNKRQKAIPHFFINYKQLPDIIWDHVLPNLGIELRAKDVHRMEKVAAMYTQGRKGGGGTNKVFAGDSENKEANAPFDVAQAAQLFMDFTYEKLERLSAATLKSPILETAPSD